MNRFENDLLQESTIALTCSCIYIEEIFFLKKGRKIILTICMVCGETVHKVYMLVQSNQYGIMLLVRQGLKCNFPNNLPSFPLILFVCFWFVLKLMSLSWYSNKDRLDSDLKKSVDPWRDPWKGIWHKRCSIPLPLPSSLCNLKIIIKLT